MLSFQTQPDVVKEMQDIINSGKFFSVTFIKKDGSIRFVNGHKIIYQSTSPSTENRGKFDRLAQNILLVWDNNRINDLTGEKGQYISVTLGRLLFFKSGAFLRDYTQENADAIKAARITPEQIEQIKSKMKIDGIVQEELESLYEGFDYNKVLGKVIATTQQMIDQAKADDITAIEPDSTWETTYQFESIRLMSTQLVVTYLENGGQGWQNKTDVTNLTQDRTREFMDSKAVISWVRRAIRKGYTAERRDMKAQTKLDIKQDNLQEASGAYGIQQLAQIIAELNGETGIDGPYYEGALDTLTKAFRYGGDEAVQQEFKANTDKDLQILSKGRYSII
jgi:hypothetical protein